MTVVSTIVPSNTLDATPTAPTTTNLSSGPSPGIPTLEIVATIIGALAFIALALFAVWRWRHRANRVITFPNGHANDYQLQDFPRDSTGLRRRTPVRATEEPDVAYYGEGERHTQQYW
jgi:hypothetical protein